MAFKMLFPEAYAVIGIVVSNFDEVPTRSN